MTRRTALGALAARSVSASSEPALIEKHGVPGAVVAFAEDGSAPAIRAYGLAGQAPRRSMTPDTPFEAASLSKPVAAGAALRICEQGRLNLDTELGEVLKAGDLPLQPEIQRIRLRHILSHTSGIPPDPPKGRSVTPMFPPGTRFAYSPHAFDYLQRVLETVTGEPLARLIRRLVFEPLAMTASAFDWSESFAAVRAIGHAANGQPGQLSTSASFV